MARRRHLAGQRARARAQSAPPPAVGAATTAGTSVLDRPRAPDRAAGEPEPDRPSLRTEPEPVEREPATRPPRVLHLGLRRRAGRRSPRHRASTALLAGVLVLALAALAALGVVVTRVRGAGAVETARDQALAAAQDRAVDVLSYDYRHLDRDFARARADLTGGFAKDYAATTSKLVRPGARQYKVVVRAEVAAASVVSAGRHRVVVLLFVNQTTTSTRLDGPKVDLNRVRLTMTDVHGRWLVSDVQAL